MTLFRSEAAANLRLAAPLIAAQITFIGMGVLDTIMAGRLGGRELAAIAVGANIWMQAFVFFMGLVMAVSPIVAQRMGGGQAPERIGDFLRQVFALCLLLGLFWIIMIRVIAAPVIGLLHLAPATAQLAHDYLMAESWSGLLFCLCFTLRYAAEGMGLSRVVLIAGLGGLAVKAVANYVFVYGHWDIPPLGAVGFGWATVAASMAMLLIYVAQFRWVRALSALRVFAQRPRLGGEGLEVIRLGVPIGLILFAEAAFFGCTALLMARFGDNAVAAHQVAINFASVVFMVPLGLSLATTVRVGRAAGARLNAEALLRGQVGMSLGLCFALFSAALMGLKPEWITGIYTQAPGVDEQAQTFLRFAALFQFFDCLQVTANGALRGIKDTRVPMLVTITAYWLVGMPAAYAFAFPWGYGPNALWWGFSLGLGVAALGLSTRFLGKVRRLRLA